MDQFSLVHQFVEVFQQSFNHTVSQAAIAAALYFASMLDRATIGCYLLLQEISPLPSENINPEVDLLSNALPIQCHQVEVVVHAYRRYHNQVFH